jgi:type VI secretion system secreted protein Hcp
VYGVSRLTLTAHPREASVMRSRRGPSMIKHVIKLFLAVAVVAGVTFQAHSAHAAVDAFLVFADTLGGQAVCKGASTDVAHPGAIQVASFDFGVENTLNIGSASSGAGAGKAKFTSFTFNHTLDIASSCISTYLAQGKTLTASLYLRKAGGNATGPDFLVVQFKTVMFSTQHLTSATDVPTEAVTFQFGSESFKYYAQTASGQLGTANTFTWDVVRNVNSF